MSVEVYASDSVRFNPLLCVAFPPSTDVARWKFQTRPQAIIGRAFLPEYGTVAGET